MEEKTTPKYCGKSIKYKEVETATILDQWGRPMKFKAARQSDAERKTNEDTGLMYWTGGEFFDVFFGINLYLPDDEYDALTEERLMELCEKINIS